MTPYLDIAKTEKVRKIDAAARELDTAVMLWFKGEDAVSIHLLACSAYQIVNDLCPSDELLYNSLVFKDEYRREVNTSLKSAYNFFKHADNDADGVIDFRPSMNFLFIMFCCKGLQLLGVKPTIRRDAFMLYFWWLVTIAC